MTNPAPHSAPDAAELLRLAQQMPHARIAKLKHNGRRYWIKRAEVTPLRFRLQKGNGAVAFRREVARLKAFAAKGLPVPPILAETPDMIVLAHAGKPLTRLARRGTDDEIRHVLSLAAEALAQLHKAGLSHGRPRLRDICWNKAEIRFLDLEAGRGCRRRACGRRATFWYSCIPFFKTTRTFLHMRTARLPPMAVPIMAGLSRWHAEWRVG